MPGTEIEKSQQADAAMEHTVTPPAGSWMSRIEEHPAWCALAKVTEDVTALIPLRGFTVRALLLLEEGQLIGSQYSPGADIPLKVGDVQIAWGEFEVVEHTMALRITRVA